jgi:hypothetical protein
MGPQFQKSRVEHDRPSRVGSTTLRFELTVVVSLLRYFLCLIAVVPSLTVAAEACWVGWQTGGHRDYSVL